MKRDNAPRGGNGGSVELRGTTGSAVGGNGGRGGSQGFGSGGDGGGGTLDGPGFIRGGDGGDAGRPARPALGAKSPLAYQDQEIQKFSFDLLPGLKDRYGLYIPGRGGDSYIANVIYEGRSYCLNVLLHLIRDLDDNLIDAVDNLSPPNEQAWWNLAVLHFPEKAQVVMAHMRKCEDKNSS